MVNMGSETDDGSRIQRGDAFGYRGDFTGFGGKYQGMRVYQCKTLKKILELRQRN